MKMRGAFQACAIVLAVLIALTGCAGSVSAQPQASTVEKDTREALDFLTASSADFTSIDAMLGDKDLDLLGEDAFNWEGLTDESIAKSLAALDSYSSGFTAKLDEIKNRSTPDNADIALFKKAELLEFETAADIINECRQVLIYADSLLNIGKELDQLGNVDTTDPEAAFKAFNESIGKTITKLKEQDVPSFLKGMNDSLISALVELSDADLYALQASALTDPVRLNSAQYRLGILMRKVNKISAVSKQDFSERGTKLKGDLKTIQLENDGLKNWVQQNIDKLGGN